MVNWLLIRVPKPFNRETIIFFKQVALGKPVAHKPKEEVRDLPHTIHKNLLKIDQRSKCKHKDYKTLGRKHKCKSSWT